MKTFDSSILFDTNVLIYNQDKTCPQYEKVFKLHQQASDGKIQAVVSSQNFTEFISVITNPKRIINPLSQEKAIDEIENYFSSQVFNLIYPTAKTFSIFMDLTKKYSVKKPMQFFDLFLTATMLTWGVTKIATFNTDDFKNIKEIEIFNF